MEAEPLELEDGEIVDDEVRDTYKFLFNKNLTYKKYMWCVYQINDLFTKLI